MGKPLAILILFVGFIVLTIICALIAAGDDDLDGGYGY